MNNIARKAVLNSQVIDVDKLRNNDMGELLKLAFQLDPKAVEESFARAGVKVQDYTDIALMTHLHRTGGDELGVLTNRFGNKIVFSVEKTLHTTKSDFARNFKQKQLNLKWK